MPGNSRRGPNDTPARAIRIPEDLWLAFSDAVEKTGTNRATTVVEFIRWYIRDPLSKLPARPDTPTPRRTRTDP